MCTNLNVCLLRYVYSICPTTLKIPSRYNTTKVEQCTLNTHYHDYFTRLLYFLHGKDCQNCSLQFNILCFYMYTETPRLKTPNPSE